METPFSSFSVLAGSEVGIQGTKLLSEWSMDAEAVWMKDSFGAQSGKGSFFELVASENKGWRFWPFSLLIIINLIIMTQVNKQI